MTPSSRSRSRARSPVSTSGGPVAVTANVEGHPGSAQVTVVNAAVGERDGIAVRADRSPPAPRCSSSAVLKDDQGNVLIGRAVLWTTSDPVRASVSNTGLVTGLVPGGPVTILATSEGRSGTAQVTVVDAAVATVTVSPSTSTIPAGTTVQLSAALKDDQGNVLTGRAVLWTTSDPARASVSNTGLVTGLAPGGPVAITATVEGHSGTAQVTVVDAAVATVTVSPSTSTIPAGTTVQLSAALKDDQGNVLTGRAVLWTTSDPARASVSNTGLVTGLAPGGPVTILATSEGRSGTAQVTVTSGAAAKLAFRTQPSNTVAGVAMTPSVQVEVQDAAGGRVMGSTVPA